MAFTRRSSGADRTYQGQASFQHWYRDNQVYFLTARCKARYPAFKTDAAKDIFWRAFAHYTARFGFVPWASSIVDNHYHTVGYLPVGMNLGAR